MAQHSDLLIIGGGPAGLCAAINGASEGLKVRLLDNGLMLGGQARESAAIENYPGFPDGVTGNNLMSAFVRQAHRFDTAMACPLSAAALERLDGGLLRITTDDYQEFTARAVLLAMGLQYRRHDAANIGQFVGRGVYYGIPAAHKPAKGCVAVIGGANSAGQAALNLARSRDVVMLIRKTLDTQMSDYLVRRIVEHPRIAVMDYCEVTRCHGSTALEGISFKRGDAERALDAAGMYIFIGAVPRTLWLRGTLALDERGYVSTWHDLPDTAALPYETSIRGVFAAGDIRQGSTKRIATACGEGAGALQMVHRRFGE